MHSCMCASKNVFHFSCKEEKGQASKPLTTFAITYFTTKSWRKPHDLAINEFPPCARDVVAVHHYFMRREEP
eukprot:scaffold129832_cov17-Tisochrysis_lutea.AAC.2